MRSIWNAVLHVVKTGCQWRMLPANFAKWQLVYYYYNKWMVLNCFDLLQAKLREKVQLGMGQNKQASLGIMDSQSVRWGNNRALNSYDGNKKVKGIKRHLVTDKDDFLLAVIVIVAHVYDSKAALLLVRALKELFCGIRTIVADGGYRGELAAEIKKRFDYALQIVMCSDDKKTGFKLTPKRWVVERTFSWSP